MIRDYALSIVAPMPETLAALADTPLPNALIGLGVLMLLLSLIERRVAAILGGMSLILGMGVVVAPSLIQHSDRRLASAVGEPVEVQVVARPEASPPADTQTDRTSEEPVISGAEAGLPGCSTKYTTVEPATAADSADRSSEVLYYGFLASVMPPVELLPCATREFSSRPLSPRGVAESDGRAEVEALRVLTAGSFAGLERTYGSGCLNLPGKDEVPLVLIRVLRFESSAAGASWDALPWTLEAIQVRESHGHRLAWFRGTCSDVPVAVLDVESRVGNVVVRIALHVSLENLADEAAEDYAVLLADSMVGNLMVLAEE